MNLLWKRLVLPTLLVAAGTAFAQQNLVLRVSDYVPLGHAISDSAKFWMAEVEKASNGAVKFEYFPSEQLGKAKDQLALAQSGVVDISLVVPSNNSDKLPLSAVAELPGLGDPKTSCTASIAYTNLARDGIFAKQEYGPAGFRMIWGFSLPPYQLVMAKRPLVPLKSIEGAKIRVLGSSIDTLVRQLNGVPVRMAGSDIFEALSRGTIDGVVYAPATLFTYKMEGLVKYVSSNASLGSPVGGYAISEKRWRELPATVQKAMLQAGDQAVRHLCARTDKDDREALDKLKQRGVSIVSFTPGGADHQELEKVYSATSKEWLAGMEKRGKPAREALKALQDAMAQAR